MGSGPDEESPGAPAVRSGAARTRLVEGIGRDARRWWAATRQAGRGRRAYELVLALAMSATTCFGTVAYDVHPPGLSPPAAGVVAGLAVLVLVPLRRVRPLGALLAGAVVGLVGEGSLLLVVLCTSAGYRSRHAGRLVVAMAASAALWLVSLWRFATFRGVGGLVFGVVFFTLCCAVPAWIAWTVGRRRRLLATMHWRNMQLHDQQASMARQARERERTRIARDLHDSVGHQLTLVSLYAGTLESMPAGRRGEAITLLRSATSAAMDELRLSLGMLSDGEDRPGVGSNPLSSLDDLVDGARSVGAQLTLDQLGEPRQLPSFIEQAAYRTLQEGVTNALRHARGSRIRVTLRWEPDVLVAEVVNGPGGTHGGPTSRQGLIGLDERIRVAGGMLRHGRTGDDGYRVAAMLPYSVRHADADADADPDLDAGPDGQGLPPAVVAFLAADLAGRDAAGDFAETMRRQARRSRLRLAAVATGLLLIFSIMVGALVFVAMAPGWTVDAEVYRTVRVGRPEGEVRALLPEPAAAVTDAVGAPPPPQGASCIDYEPDLAAQLDHDSLYDLVYRFCFRGGRLVHKEAYDDVSSA